MTRSWSVDLHVSQCIISESAAAGTRYEPGVSWGSQMQVHRTKNHDARGRVNGMNVPSEEVFLVINPRAGKRDAFRFVSRVPAWPVLEPSYSNQQRTPVGVY